MQKSVLPLIKMADSADWTVSFCTCCFYFHLFFWFVHMIYIICCSLGAKRYGPKKYKKYLKKEGCFKFQADLGIVLLNYAIQAEWIDLSEPRHDWIRSGPLVPCECSVFFCSNGLTHGNDHKSKWKVVTTFVHHNRSITMTCGCTKEQVDLQ